MDTDVSREESLNKLLAELGNARIHFDKSQKEEFRKCMLSSSVDDIIEIVKEQQGSRGCQFHRSKRRGWKSVNVNVKVRVFSENIPPNY